MQEEGLWDFLRACANLPWAILLGISFGFWFVVFLLGTTWLAEGLWHPSPDTRLLAGGSAVTALIAALLMIAFTYFTMVLRRRILSFVLALAAWLFIRALSTRAPGYRRYPDTVIVGATGPSRR